MLRGGRRTAAGAVACDGEDSGRAAADEGGSVHHRVHGPADPRSKTAAEVAESTGARFAAAGAGATEVPGIRAKRAHHVWHVDLTLVPLVGRFFAGWFPFSVPQCWPFYWWVGGVLDQYSRAVMAKAVFRTQPSAAEVCRMLDRGVRRTGCAPGHIISDQGGQFQGEYRDWCKKVGAKPRFGAVGSSASIAVLERFWRSMKDECFRVIHVPHALHAMRAELDAYVVWYNEHRPHQSFRGLTPKERLDGADLPTLGKSGGKPRSEPRAPPVLVVTKFRGREHLPIVEIRQAA